MKCLAVFYKNYCLNRKYGKLKRIKSKETKYDKVIEKKN